MPNGRYEPHVWNLLERRIDRKSLSHPKHGRCWEWTGSVGNQGYGIFKRDNFQWKAHRLVYSLVVGSVPDGLWVLHKCDHPLCVRPSHLFLGTPTDNHKDMVAKGRNAKAETNGRAVLTWEGVREIRRRYKRYHPTNNRITLAREFGVSRATIDRVLKYENWL